VNSAAEGNVLAFTPTSAITCCAESTPKPGTSAKDYILFYEYFHGDNGAGLGASHQTGWTGLVAKLIELFGRLDERQFLDAGKSGAFARTAVATAGK
jgi:hypothetical protein